MAVIHARTFPEAHEYMVLAMGDCADQGLTVTRIGVVGHVDGWAHTYAVDCASTGEHREFTFTTEDEPDPAPERLVFGYTAEPSRLIDAGQWYAVFYHYADAVRDAQERSGGVLPDLATARDLVGALERARAAVDEILKFIPAGSDTVPGSAFWTDDGRAVHDLYPAEFSRPSLERHAADLAAAIEAYVARYREQ
jgi:hypothetical protein